MAINHLQPAASTTVLPEPGVAKKNSAAGHGFDAQLAAARSTEGGASPQNGQQAVAELLRMQMTQNSLSLAGHGEASVPSGIKAMEALLYRFAGNSGEATAGKGHGGQTSDQQGAVRSEAPVGPSSGGKSDLSDVSGTAARFLGTPYRFGGEGPTGIDCSSFVQQVFREHEIELPRTAREQILVGQEVAEGDLQKGDLVFFQTYASYPSHVGIYLGEGKMMHASSGKGEVTVSDLNSEYYRSRYLGAKRVA